MINPLPDGGAKTASLCPITGRSQSPSIARKRIDTYTFIHICCVMRRSPIDAPAFLFKTLCDTTRLRLLNLLSAGETCVCELTDALHIIQPKVSRHLASLKRAGLVETRREGKWMYYRLPRHGDPLARHVLDGLQVWMEGDARMNGERQRREKVCYRSRQNPGRTSIK
jgi:ArsR family transcriptional regulator, arsenate/arsenite/antimonite-responsive transcriptional repressor